MTFFTPKEAVSAWGPDPAQCGAYPTGEGQGPQPIGGSVSNKQLISLKIGAAHGSCIKPIASARLPAIFKE